MVGSVPIDDGGKIALAQITFGDALILGTQMLSNFKHVVGFECHDRVLFSVVLQQQHLIVRNFIELF